MTAKNTGYDAIVHGILQSNVAMVSGFAEMPLTPIFDQLEGQIKELHAPCNIDRSINEKVCFEIALGASMSNARSIAIMKHTGINIAADSFMTGCYAGALGGLVVLIVDDPGMVQSKNEQDSRFWALHALVPMFEPSTPQECYEMLQDAFVFSEKYETIVLFRVTLSFLEQTGVIELKSASKWDRTYKFDEAQRARWTHLPTNARVNRIKLLDRLKKITAGIGEFSYNKEIIQSIAMNGIICANTLYTQITDNLQTLGLTDLVSIFKIGCVYPLSSKKIANFLGRHKKVVVIEELEPFLESQIKEIAFTNEIKVDIVGKNYFPQMGAITSAMLFEKLGEILEIQKGTKPKAPEPSKPTDISAFASLVPITNLMNQIKKIEAKLKISCIHAFDLEYDSSDSEYPFDLFIGRGSSFGMGSGFSKTETQPFIVFVSPQTFLHSGISALINAVYNQNSFIVVFLDNRAIRKQYPELNFSKMILGSGVDRSHLYLPHANKTQEMDNAIEDALNQQGLRVIYPQVEEGN